MYNNELYHHGILGQKWGVRRFQNKDGSWTDEGKRHRNPSEKRKMTPEEKRKAIKTTVDVVGALAITTAAAIYISKHPEKITKVIDKVSKVNIKDVTNKSVELGKKAVNKALNTTKIAAKDAVQSAKEGVKEGIKEAPKKLTKSVVTGAVMIGGKKILDKAIGEKESEKIFKANNKDKIDKFWKVMSDDDEDNKKKR